MDVKQNLRSVIV